MNQLSIGKKQMEKKKINKTRQKIKQGGRVGYIISKTVGILMLLFIIFHCAVMLLIWIDEKNISRFGWLYQDNSLYRLLHSEKFSALFWSGNKNILEGLPLKDQALIGIFVSLLAWLVLLIFVRHIAQFMKFLADGGRPFSVEIARRMRRYAFLFILLIIYNPLLGFVSFGLVIFFSYIMEYGGYIQEQADETNRIQEEVIFSFAEITENKSGQTGQHIKRVSEYSRILAEQMGLDSEDCDEICIASTMHDVGKLMIPSEILDKPGKLTDEEYAIIKTHTTYGGKLLENVEGDELKLSRTIALQHHERYDGHGYPSQLSSDDISLEGRIVSVADVYDALTSRRSYKDAWSEEDAYREILKGKGTQFDPQVVDAFEAAHDKIMEVRQKFAD